MTRWLLAATLLALGACAAPSPDVPPGSAAGASSAGRTPGGFPMSLQPRVRAPSSERPAWLPVVPSPPERYPAPENRDRAGMVNVA